MHKTINPQIVCQACIIFVVYFGTRENSKPWFLYTTLPIVSSMEFYNATSFNHCKVIIYTLQVNIIYIKLMVDHEINEPLKPYSCQSNFYVGTYPRYVICILFELLRFEKL